MLRVFVSPTNLAGYHSLVPTAKWPKKLLSTMALVHLLKRGGLVRCVQVTTVQYTTD